MRFEYLNLIGNKCLWVIVKIPFFLFVNLSVVLLSYAVDYDYLLDYGKYNGQNEKNILPDIMILSDKEKMQREKYLYLLQTKVIDAGRYLNSNMSVDDYFKSLRNSFRNYTTKIIKENLIKYLTVSKSLYPTQKHQENPYDSSTLWESQGISKIADLSLIPQLEMKSYDFKLEYLYPFSKNFFLQAGRSSLNKGNFVTFGDVLRKIDNDHFVWGVNLFLDKFLNEKSTQSSIGFEAATKNWLFFVNSYYYNENIMKIEAFDFKLTGEIPVLNKTLFNINYFLNSSNEEIEAFLKWQPIPLIYTTMNYVRLSNVESKLLTKLVFNFDLDKSIGKQTQLFLYEHRNMIEELKRTMIQRTHIPERMKNVGKYKSSVSMENTNGCSNNNFFLKEINSSSPAFIVAEKLVSESDDKLLTYIKDYNFNDNNKEEKWCLAPDSTLRSAENHCLRVTIYEAIVNKKPELLAQIKNCKLPAPYVQLHYDHNNKNFTVNNHPVISDLNLKVNGRLLCIDKKFKGNNPVLFVNRKDKNATTFCTFENITECPISVLKSCSCNNN